MRKKMAGLVLAWLLLCMIAAQSLAVLAEENQTEKNAVPLTVGTAQDLEQAKEQLEQGLSVSVTLTGDLILDDWNGLGSQEHPFTGTFNGGGHTVTIRDGKSFLGTVSQAEVENLTIMGTVLDSAALASFAEETTFTDCGNAAWVLNKEGGRTCGLVGVSAAGNSYIRCYNTGIVQSANQDQVVCGIASDYQSAAGIASKAANNSYSYCYNGGALLGTTLHAIGEANTGSVSIEGKCYSVVSSSTGSSDVTHNFITPASMAGGNPPPNWGGEWTYAKGLYPHTARQAVTDGDIALSAAAWVEGSNVIFNTFEEGFWKTQDGLEIKQGSSVSLPGRFTFTYLGLSREVWLDGNGTATAQVRNAAILSIEDKQETTVYLDELDYLLENQSTTNGIWSLFQGTLPQGLKVEGDRLLGPVEEMPGEYDLQFACRDQATRQYALLNVELTIKKAEGGITLSPAQMVYSGKAWEPEYTLAEHTRLEKILYTEENSGEETDQPPVNAGTYTVTLYTAETEYYQAGEAAAKLVINPYILDEKDFESSAPSQGVPCTDQPAQPHVSPVSLEDCVTPGPDDYTVTYQNNKQPTYKEGDPAQILIEPKGNYTTADGQPLAIPFTIYVGGTEVMLEPGRGYTLGTPDTSWTLNGEENKVTYTGGNLFYVTTPGAYHFARSA